MLISEACPRSTATAIYSAMASKAAERSRAVRIVTRLTHGRDVTDENCTLKGVSRRQDTSWVESLE